MNPNAPYTVLIGPGDLRKAYGAGKFTFGNPDAGEVVCLVGSCRIAPILNYFRAYNSLHGDRFELICLNPVEMWEGDGTSLADGTRKCLADFRFGKVDFLICEHMVNCGVLNTLDSPAFCQDHTRENLFKSLGCAPGAILRLPNWHTLHIYDAETAGFDPSYAAMDPGDRKEFLRRQVAEHKERYLGYCRDCSFPEMEQWTLDNWTKVRMGWTNSHATRELSWKLFELIARDMGLEIIPQLAAHPFCTRDMFVGRGHHTELTPLDYEVNGWEFRNP